ncbi:21133_t:CDS:2, partial [Cetraspora pellucida]
MITGDTIIKWYSYTNRAASEDYIRATSNYYNELSFSDVSISVDKSEEFRTDNGTCFCKILILITVIIENYSTSFNLALVQ